MTYWSTMSAYSMQKMWTFLAYWGVFVPLQIPPAYGPGQSVESTVSEKPWRVYVLILTVVADLHVGILLLDYGRLQPTKELRHTLLNSKCSSFQST